MSQLVHVFECKSETKSIFGINYFNNLKLIAAVLVSVAVLAAAIYVPAAAAVFSTVALGKKEFLISLGFSVAVPFLSGIVHSFGRKKSGL